MEEVRFERSASLLAADIGDEMVALDAEAGQCYGFNSVSASTWRLLEQPRSFEELQAALLDEYDVPADQCASDLQQLLDDLSEKGLVRRT